MKFINMSNKYSRKFLLPSPQLGLGDEIINIHNSCLAEVEEEYPTGCTCHSFSNRHKTHLAYGPFNCKYCEEKYYAFVQYKNIATRIHRRELGLNMVRELDDEADKVLASRKDLLLFEDVQKHQNKMASCLSDIAALGWRNSTIDDPTDLLPPELELPDEHIECQAGDYDPFRSPDRDSSDESYGFKSDADSSDGGVQEMIYSMMRTVQDHLDDTIMAGPQHLEMFRFIEALMFFLLIDLPRAETFAGYSIASYRFLSSVTGKCALEVYHWCIELICDFELPCKPQSATEVAYTALEKVTQFLQGTMMVKLKKFFFALTAIGVGRIFSIDIDKSRFEELWITVGTFFKKSDTICNIFDFIAWLVKNISDYFSGKTTIGKLLFDETDANNFDGRVAALDSIYNVLKTGDQTEYTVQQFAFEIAQLENIANAELVAAKDSKTLRIAISRQLQKILVHKANLQVLSSMRCLRVAPFSVCLVGGTSVGKSCLTSLMVPMLQTACDVASGPEFTFNWDADDKYASGYTSTITAIAIDDLANIQAQFATVQAAELVLFLINNFRRKANMAAIDDKGMVNIEPAVVLGSSNDETLGSLVSCCPLSILRRFNYHLAIKVKPCCSVNGMFKVSMDHIPSDHHYDCWVIDIYHYEPDPSNINSNKLYIKTMDMVGVSLSDATLFLTNAAKTYSTRQKQLVQYMNNVHVQPYCAHGIFEHICKICTAVQVIAEPIGEAIAEAPLEQQAGPWPPRISTGLDSPTFMRTLPGRALIMRAFSDVVSRGVGWHRASKLYVAYSDLCLRPLEWHQILSASVITGLTAVCCAFTLDSFLMAFISICLAAIVSVITTTVGRVVHTLQMSLPETVCAGMKIIKRKSKRWAKEYGPILLIIGLCSGGYIAMRSKLETQGARASIPLKQECTNKKDGYRTVLIETSDRNRDLATSTSTDIAEMLSRRIYVGIFTKPKNGSDESTYCNLIPVTSGYWLIPYHVLNEGYTQIRIIRKDSLHLNDSRSAKLDGAWRRIGTTDMCIVALPIMGDQRNIMNLLPSREQHGDRYTVKDTGALLIWAKPTKRVVTDNVTEHVRVESGVEKVNASSEMVKIDGLDQPYWGGQYRTVLETWRGMCGSVLITDTPGPTIIGFHSAGVTGKTTSRFCTIMREDVENMIASMCNEGAHVQMAESGDFVKELTFSGTAFLHTFDTRPHSTTEYIEGEFTHLGWNTAQKRSFRSSVVETPFAQDICDKFCIDRTHERSPFMNTYIPWNKWLDAAGTRSDVPYTILDKAYEDYNHKIHKFWDDNPQLNWDNRIHPLAHDAILAGADGVLGCYAMNLNTSAGIPWGKRKKTMIFDKDEPVEGITRPLEIDPKVMETVYAAEQKMAKRERVYFPHRCNLKDEPVKIGKEKVRVFMGSNLTYLYLMRKYFLTLSMLMQHHFDVFESAVGVNAASYEWTLLHNYIFKYSDEHCIAGDYGKYDQRFSVKVSLASFKILIGMLVRAGYTKEQLNCCTVLMTETCIGVYDVNGEWVMFAGLNPSGHGLTVVINGIGNSLYVRCGYYLLKPPNETRLFDELVALMTYGDDNVMSVHDDAPWFNHTSLQRAMAEFGMEYTMADKEADSVPYIPKSKCSFLKRTWVWSEKYGRYLCPIEELSIFKTLTVMKKSEVLTTDQQCAELLSNANREYFFYGEEIFNDQRAILHEIGVKYGVLHHLAKCDLPTFEELEIWYMSS